MTQAFSWNQKNSPEAIQIIVKKKIKLKTKLYLKFNTHILNSFYLTYEFNK